MTKPFQLGEQLFLPTAALTYETGRRLHELELTKGIIESHNCYGSLARYAQAGHCEMTPAPGHYTQLLHQWISGCVELCVTQKTGVFSIQWRGHSLQNVSVKYQTSCGEEIADWIIAETIEVAKAFLLEAESWDADLRKEMWVFDDGSWSKSAELYEGIQGSTLDNIVLPAALKNDLVGDLDRFLAARENYRKYGIPWKRGLLLVGPPGNGKTHAIKALINHTGQDCLYVKSFRSSNGTETPRHIRSVFEHARETTPCILVLEDLDSLIKDDNRSFFLNELDGFAKNDGIILISTTNHADRLDPAIVDRPSRFDRKFHFTLPAVPERRAFLQLWSDRLDPELRLSEADVVQLAQGTDDFSFAYLRELMITSMTRWIDPDNQRSMGDIARALVPSLRSQMVTVAAGDAMG